MDMHEIKALFDNNVQKNVKKITDVNGNIVWYKVPDEYRKVEYLESSDGTSYIDTSLIPTATMKAQIKFQLNTTHRNRAGVFGSFPTGRARFQIFGSDDNMTFGIGNGYNGNNSRDSLSNSPHIAVLDGKNLAVSLDGVQQLATTGAYSNPAGVCSIYIFASNQNTPYLDNSKIWYTLIWDNDILIRHFIPVVRNSDDKPGMYDLVNDVFYTNVGTGEFTWGGVIDNNLFLGFDSPWCCNFSIAIADGKCATQDGNRTTYFFKVKPNTTYRYTATTAGDRFTVYAIKNEYDTPPTFVKSMYPYTETQNGIRAIENSPITNTDLHAATTDYTFTTGPDDKMVYIYLALEKKPTGVRIVEVEN